MKNKRLKYFQLLLISFSFMSLSVCAKQKIHLLQGQEKKLEDGFFSTFSSSNDDIVSVDEKGNVKAIQSGSATITKKQLWNTETYKIKVSNPTLNQNHATVYYGDNYEIEIYNADNVVWEDNSKGNIYSFQADNVGEYDIKANADGKELNCHVSVPKPYLNNISIEKDDIVDIPSKNFNFATKYSSSNPDVAEIKDGKIYGKNVGTAKLIATTKNQKFESNIIVNGNQELSILSHNCLINEKQELTIKNFIPSYKVKWKGVQMKDGKAIFHKDKIGEYEVKAIVDLGKEKKTLKTKIQVDDVIDENEKKVYIGDTFQLSHDESIEYDFDPEFFSLDNNVFTVLKNGNTLIEAYKGEISERCDISIGDGGKGDDVIAYAMQFLGNPYVYGGSSLTNGTDCSGFTMRVYEQFGISLPHSSYAQRSYGTAVDGIENAKAGDIICYNGHVALYMGNNKIIHASTPSTGIKISDNANYRPIVAIRRLF